MDAKLIVVGGKANKSVVKLTLPAVLGRGRDVNLTVAHKTVSRHHCMLEEVNGEVMVRDNNSLNGTLVDGERITEAVLLRPGQTLTVGPITFRADYDQAPVAQIAPAINDPAEELEPEFDLSLGETDEPSASPPTIVEHEPTLELSLNPGEDEPSEDGALEGGPLVSEDEADDEFSLSLESDAASIADDLSPSPASPAAEQLDWEPPADPTDDASFDFLAKDDDSNLEEVDTAVMDSSNGESPPKAESTKTGGAWWSKGKKKEPEDDDDEHLTESESDEPTRVLPPAEAAAFVAKPAAASGKSENGQTDEQKARAPAEKSKVSGGKGGEVAPPSAESKPAESADDDELNDFFQSLGMN